MARLQADYLYNDFLSVQKNQHIHRLGKINSTKSDVICKLDRYKLLVSNGVSIIEVNPL